MKQVSKPEDVPIGRHYALIVYKTDSVYIPGDERSRTNPGHGYGERTETYNVFEHYVTTDRNDWEVTIERHEKEKMQYRGSPYIAFVVEQTATVKTKTSIEIT